MSVMSRITCSTSWGVGGCNHTSEGQKGSINGHIVYGTNYSEREKKCRENFQILVMWLKKTDKEGVYSAFRYICE